MQKRKNNHRDKESQKSVFGWCWEGRARWMLMFGLFLIAFVLLAPIFLVINHYDKEKTSVTMILLCSAMMAWLLPGGVMLVEFVTTVLHERPHAHLSPEDIDMDELMAMLAHDYGFEFTDIDEIDISEDIVRKIPLEAIRKYCVLPLYEKDGTLTIAMADPTDMDTLDEIRRILQADVEAVICSRERLEEKIKGL